DSGESPPPPPPAPPVAPPVAPPAVVPDTPRSLGKIGDLNTVAPLPPAEERPSPLALPGSGAASPSPAAPATTDLPSGTFAGDKALQIESDLARLQQATQAHTADRNRLQQEIVAAADRYRANAAGVGASASRADGSADPAAVRRWHAAEADLNTVQGRLQELEQLRSRIVADAALAGYLAEQSQAAGQLTGAVAADQRRLRGLETRSQQTQVALKDLLGEVDDDILRQSAYVTREQRDLTRRSSGIKSDTLYGEAPPEPEPAPLARRTDHRNDWTGLPSTEPRRPVATARPTQKPVASRATTRPEPAPRPPQRAASAAPTAAPKPAPAPARPAAAEGSRRPLLEIPFPQDKVDYEAALYAAISEAVARNPSARFEVVAVSPAGRPGALPATARQKAQRVTRSLITMGVPSARLQQSVRTTDGSGPDRVLVYMM
ncbi:MAG: hypothetical protein KDC18_11640, partial [Alphaproteobacteria bacterium]|nr:hypothetical protein [Alphaproteobacteria bacterium]